MPVANTVPQELIRKTAAPGLNAVRLRRQRLDEFFITATPVPGDDFHRVFDEVHRVVQETGATIVAQNVFGIPSVEPAGVTALREEWSRQDWPVTWLVQGGGAGMALTGLQVHAVKGVAVERIRMQGRVIGSVFDDGFARHCCLGDLRPRDASAAPELQARETLELLEAALGSVGMGFPHVVRTWFYLDRILSWYSSFNRVRNRFFRERRVFEGLVPASTGIGSANASRTALIADAYALQPRSDQVRVQAVPSPLQCPAPAYGSSFSRAVEVGMPDHRRLWISGTASIDSVGHTTHAGDPAGQIDRTMMVVSAILESRRMSWEDVTRAVAYVKPGAQAGRLVKLCTAPGLGDLAMVISESEICRDELLFEIEVDACRRP